MFNANSHGRVSAVFSAAVLALLWSGQGMAASACLKGDSLNKLCLSLTSQPATEVQPSGLAETKTFVKYEGAVRNLVAATSRYVQTTVTIDPAPASALTFTADPGLACSVSGATLTCLADKIEGIKDLTFTLTAEAPTYPATATQMVATGVIGWNGNTATLTHALAVSDTAGESYVPPDTEVTLATDDSDDVTAEKPRYGRITLPPQPFAYVASIEVVGNAPANANCVDGIYLSTSYGGPYVCRDTATPQRAIRIDLGSAEFTADDPIVFVEKWDTTIVPATQLPPTPAAPTGLPPFAQFTAPLAFSGSPSAPYSAWSLPCGTDSTGALVEAPCIERVQQLANGDWQVDSLRTSHETELARQSPYLAPLYAVLDFLVTPAHAQITLPTKPGIGFAQ
jgi:hypothetical protein